MVHILSSTDFRYPDSRTAAFEGKAFGANVSFFIVDEDPGEGPALHLHNYPETWIVQAGTAQFTVSGSKLKASKGDIVVLPPLTPHKFVNSGTAALKMICIHPNQSFEQVDIPE